VLREAVMIFTNQIARIVHSSVHASGGDVNKNIGDGNSNLSLALLIHALLIQLAFLSSLSFCCAARPCSAFNRCSWSLCSLC